MFNQTPIILKAIKTTVQFSSRWYRSIQKSHLCAPPHLRTFPNAVFETVVVMWIPYACCKCDYSKGIYACEFTGQEGRALILSEDFLPVSVTKDII